jgi:hypothetical protein
MRGVSAFVVSLALCVSAAAGATSKPEVRLVKRAPLELHGTHFWPKRIVHVTVTRAVTGAKIVRVVRATRKGAFTVSFGVLTGYDRCSEGLLVVATGFRKTTRLNIPPIECAPA